MHLAMWKLVFRRLLTILRNPRESVLSTENQANKKYDKYKFYEKKSSITINKILYMYTYISVVHERMIVVSR